MRSNWTNGHDSLAVPLMTARTRSHQLDAGDAEKMLAKSRMKCYDSDGCANRWIGRGSRKELVLREKQGIGRPRQIVWQESLMILLNTLGQVFPAEPAEINEPLVLAMGASWVGCNAMGMRKITARTLHS